MGLDISYYTHLTAAPDAELDTEGYVVDWDQYFQITDGLMKCSEGFPGAKRTEGLAAGVYAYTDEGGFRAGSYGWYGEWRRQLAKLAGFTSANEVWENAVGEGPFVELINFSDCEGVIGPVVAKKLAADFAEYEAKAAAFGEDFVDRYSKWKAAFEAAADNGCVHFH